MKEEDNKGVTSEGGARSRQTPLERYFAILETVAAHPGVGAPELADLCALPFPTVHRLIQALRKAGLLTEGERRKGYELGTRLLRLLQTGSDDSWIRITVQKKLDEIAERLGETCYAAKLVDGEVVSVAWAAPASGLRGHVVPGVSQPLHAAACAKAILAYQSSAYVRSLLPEKLPKLCVNTKTRRDDVLAELKAVRGRGFATCVNENEMGITAVACPILLVGVGVIYSIGVMALGGHLSEERIRDAVEVLTVAAKELAASTGPLRGA